MGKMLDILEKAFDSVIDDSSLIMDESFMMGIFDELKIELPPFQEYIYFIYEKGF